MPTYLKYKYFLFQGPDFFSAEPDPRIFFLSSSLEKSQMEDLFPLIMVIVLKKCGSIDRIFTTLVSGPQGMDMNPNIGHKQRDRFRLV